MSEVWLCVVEQDDWHPRISIHSSEQSARAHLREVLIADLTAGDYRPEQLQNFHDPYIARLHEDTTELRHFIERREVRP
jgi:hypothetical protein